MTISFWFPSDNTFRGKPSDFMTISFWFPSGNTIRGKPSDSHETFLKADATVLVGMEIMPQNIKGFSRHTVWTKQLQWCSENTKLAF